MLKLLIVEDERMIADFIGCGLAEANFEYDCAYDGLSAADMIDQNRYDLILLDVMLPGVDGFELMRYIAPLGIPVIFLTAKAGVDDRVAGLRLGADDYITKPFNPIEVSARVKSQLRRYMQLGGGTVRPDVIRVGGIELDDKEKRVTLDGEPVALTPTEYDILKLLMQNPGQVFSPREIYSRIWNDLPLGSENTVAVHIRHLREKLEINPAEPRYLKVVWGQGYKCEKQG